VGCFACECVSVACAVARPIGNFLFRGEVSSSKKSVLRTKVGWKNFASLANQKGGFSLQMNEESQKPKISVV
jgi:hypothetical protein